MIRTKADVDIRNSRSHRGVPCVNVKVYADCWSSVVIERVANDNACPSFVGWMQNHLEDMFNNFGRSAPSWMEHAWNAAIEQGWECLRFDAEGIFGRGVKVYSDGRSGGWCVVEGLPPVESWDALMLTKWKRFAKWARQQANAIPYSCVDYVYHNVYLPELEKHDAPTHILPCS